MKEITLELEAVTPLFIAGADQWNIENEGLRAPSLRGVMRWWFRAIMGGMVNLADLKKLEGKIFGTTNQKSNVQVISILRAMEGDIKVPGELGYLWFSIDMQFRKDKRIKCYQPESKFTLILKSMDEEAFKIAAHTLWTTLYLGGIGSRARRGAGSLKVIKTNGDPANCKFKFNGKKLGEANGFIEENLKSIFRDFKNYAGETYNPSGRISFPVLSQNCAEISLLDKLYNKYESGLKEVSEVYSRYRRNLPIGERHIFGLPIIDKLKRKSVRGFKDKREASPFLIGVMPVEEKYAIRLVKFYTSVHEEYSSKMDQVRNRLKGLDEKFKEQFRERKIEIPSDEK